MKIFFNFLCSMLLTTQMYAATWYVNDNATVGDIYCTVVGNDINNGTTAATPKQTLSTVITAAVAGDIILIDAGTHTVAATISVAKSLTLRGAGMTLSFISPSHAAKVFDITGTTSNFVFEKLNITRTSTGSGVAVISFATGNSNIIRECTVSNARGNAVVILGTTGDKADACIIEKSTFNGDAPTYVTEGLRFTHTTNLIFRKNRVLEWHSGVWFNQGNTTAKVENNYVANMLGASDNLPCGIHVESTTQTVNIHQNSVHLNRGYNLHFGVAGSHTGTEVRNNILSNNAANNDGSDFCIHFVNSSAAKFAHIDYNDYFTTWDIFGDNSGPYHSTLADFKTVDWDNRAITNGNAGSLDLNPQFADATILNLDLKMNATTVSPIFMTAPAISGITDDIYSVTRPDCGALPVAMGADDSGCKGKVAYVITGITDIAPEACICTNGTTKGWTYYSKTATLDTYIFAIERNPCVVGGGTYPNNFKATSKVQSLTSTSPVSDLLDCNGTYNVRQIMPRIWNVTTTGTGPSVANPVKVRFFYPPAEYTATKTSVDNNLAAKDAACLGASLSPSSWMWFKGANSSSDFASNKVTATDFDNSGADYVLTEVFKGIETVVANPIADGLNYVELSGVTGFSGGSGGAGGGGGPLPITLKSFKAYPNNNENTVEWIVSSQQNTEWFVIERSANGIDNWIEIEHIKAEGTTNIEYAYKINDKKPLSHSFYRLRSIDFDGLFMLSQNEIVKRKNTATLNVYPSPTSDKIMLNFDGTIAETTLQIIDALGKVVDTKTVTMHDGFNTINHDISHLPTGVYIIMVDNGINRLTERVIKE